MCYQRLPIFFQLCVEQNFRFFSYFLAFFLYKGSTFFYFSILKLWTNEKMKIIWIKQRKQVFVISDCFSDQNNNIYIENKVKNHELQIYNINANLYFSICILRFCSTQKKLRGENKVHIISFIFFIFSYDTYTISVFIFFCYTQLVTATQTQRDKKKFKS